MPGEKKSLVVAIVGLGLIGGSLALSLKKVFKKRIQIIGIDKDKKTLTKARKTKIFTYLGKNDKNNKVEKSDIVFVCVTIDQIPKILASLSKLKLRKGSIVTDTGSTKHTIFEEAKKILPKGVNFVGGHPIAGTEKSGFENANPSLFYGRIFVISGIVGSKKSSKTIEKIWKKLGCNVVTVSPKEHDRIFSYLSHLPHVLSFGLDKLTSYHLSRKTIRSYGGTSYKDYSRISASSKSLWSEIFLSNQNNLLNNIKSFKTYLTQLEDALTKESKPKIISAIKSKAARA